jgi:hypothetical protein
VRGVVTRAEHGEVVWVVVAALRTMHEVVDLEVLAVPAPRHDAAMVVASHFGPLAWPPRVDRGREREKRRRERER